MAKRSSHSRQEVKELEQRPAAVPGAWVEPLRNRKPTFGPGFEPGQLESMSPDVRTVETGGLERGLANLALTGRVTELEYRPLIERSSRVAVVAKKSGPYASDTRLVRPTRPESP